MSKYEPLKRYLSSLAAPEWRASFGDVERILGFPLPPSSRRHRALWSNNPQNHVMTRAWLEAGWRTEQVDLDEGKVVFRKVADREKAPSEEESGRRSLYGGLRGTVRTAPGLDLTEPTGEAWSAHDSRS
jgi:hypothetical protein